MKTPILTTLVIAALTGCATNTGDPQKDARARATNQALVEAGTVLGKVAVSALFNAAQQEAAGGKVDFQQAAVSGLYSSVDVADTAAAIHRVVMAYSDGEAPVTAMNAAGAFAASSAPAEQKTEAIAAVISSATGAPPAK